MKLSSPEFMYIGFILPFLFALTLVGEGLYKAYRHESWLFSFILGVGFCIAIVVGFYFIFYIQ